MKRLSLAGLLLLIVSCGFAQTDTRQSYDTVPFHTLPDTLQTLIRSKVSGLLEKDTIMDSVSYYRHQLRHIYEYKLYISGESLCGYYKAVNNCFSCAFPGSEGYLRATMLYCCKDKTHHPNETAKTKQEMLKIQARNHCSQIGICIID